MEKAAAAEILDFLNYCIHWCQNSGNFRVNNVGSESNFKLC